MLVKETKVVKIVVEHTVHQRQSQEGKPFSFSLVPCHEHPCFKLTIFVVQILTSA